MHIREITRAEAKPFVALHHYSGTVPKTIRAAYGEFNWLDYLQTVALYGPASGRLALGAFSRLSGFELTPQNAVELVRLCRTDDETVLDDNFALSQFLSKCHKKLARDHGVRFVVSYSDPNHGHSGGTYRAANFQHMGKTDPEWHGVDHHGRHVTRRTWWRFQTSDGKVPASAMSAADARSLLGIEMVKSEPKDRWLIRI